MPCNHRDVFTETPIRQIGYSGGFARAIYGSTFAGAACKSLYLLSASFILAHTAHHRGGLIGQKDVAPVDVDLLTQDTLLYESLASGLLPPLIATAVRGYVMKRFKIILFRRPPVKIATAASLVALLLLYRPADVFIDEVIMDGLVRKLYD